MSYLKGTVPAILMCSHVASNKLHIDIMETEPEITSLCVVYDESQAVVET